MFTGEEDMQAAHLKARGWSVAAIARHLGRDRKTIRDYLSGKRKLGERKTSEENVFETFIPYLTERLKEDPHVWASTLYDEVVELGFPRSYPIFTRGLRKFNLRPHCEACAGVKGRPTIEIDHPAGEETQWDWDELSEAPWGGDGHLLLGSLPCSGKFRGFFCDSEDQPHLIEGIDQVTRQLGGLTDKWRFDRMATVVNPTTGILRPSFVPVAKHYSVIVVACPPGRGNRKGSVEKSIHFATQRFWRTMTATTIPEANAQLERFCQKIADRRPRPLAKLEDMVGVDEASDYLEKEGKRRPSVSDPADLERLRPLPATVYPATISEDRTASDSGLVAFEGNFYSVPPGLIGATVLASARLGSTSFEIHSVTGRVLAVHGRVTPGTGRIVRLPGHAAELEAIILSAFTTDKPCKRKVNRPPGEAARREAARLKGEDVSDAVVVDLGVYQRLIEGIGSNGEDSTEEAGR